MYKKQEIVILNSGTKKMKNLIQIMKNSNDFKIIITQNQMEFQKYIKSHTILLFEFSQINMENNRFIKEMLEDVIPIALCEEEYYLELAEKQRFFYFDTQNYSNEFICYALKIIFYIKKEDKDNYDKLIDSVNLDMEYISYKYLITKVEEITQNIVERFELDLIICLSFQNVINYFMDDVEEKNKMLGNKRFNNHDLYKLIPKIAKTDEEEINIYNLAKIVVKQNTKLNIIKSKDGEKLEFAQIVKRIVKYLQDKYIKEYEGKQRLNEIWIS